MVVASSSRVSVGGNELSTRRTVSSTSTMLENCKPTITGRKEAVLRGKMLHGENKQQGGYRDASSCALLEQALESGRVVELVLRGSLGALEHNRC